ncbi:MAG: arylsulfotransferase family protein [Geminicoccaceae bacterium]
MTAKWDRAFFALAIAMVILGYGLAAGRYDLFPAPAVDLTVDTLRDWKKNWRHHLGIRPEQLIVKARYPGEGVTKHDPEAASQGVNFMAGMWGDQLGFRLVDMDGNERHAWDVSLNAIFGEQAHMQQRRQDWDAHIHGMHLFPDGDIVFNFEMIGLVRIDACGDTVWARPNYTHHSIFVDEKGDIWASGNVGETYRRDDLPGFDTPVMDELVVRFGPDGEEQQRISILDAILASHYEGVLLGTGHDSVKHTERDGPDILHLNDVEPLGAVKAAAFPLFDAGDIMVSLRNINTVLVLDGETGEVAWAGVGPYLAQHDPDFLEDGTISVFDNRRFDANMAGRERQSRIVTVDPATSEVSVAYGRGPSEPFYTGKMGKHERLANGNMLIAETEAGRAFEVTPDGRVVWEYINRRNEDEAAWIMGAHRYPVGYLDPDALSCS